jgi:hypothetical protein
MPNWHLNSMGWIVSFLRYAALRLFWTLRGLGRHNVIKKYRGGLKALKALRRSPFPRCGDLTSIVRIARTLPPAPGQGKKDQGDRKMWQNRFG